MNKYLLTGLLAGCSVPLSVWLERLIGMAPSSVGVTMMWALVEESLKVLVVMCAVAILEVPRSKWEKLGFISAISFACAENLLYFAGTLATHGDLPSLLVTRLLLSLPVHILSTTIALFGFSKNWRVGLAMFVLAISFHNFFNTFVFKYEVLPQWFTEGYAWFLFAFVFFFFISKIFLTLRTYKREGNRARRRADVELGSHAN